MLKVEIWTCATHDFWTSVKPLFKTFVTQECPIDFDPGNIPRAQTSYDFAKKFVKILIFSKKLFNPENFKAVVFLREAATSRTACET